MIKTENAFVFLNKKKRMLSYWEKDLYHQKYDHVIIGAGFNGLWLAYFLKTKAPNLKIAIVERGNLSQGASTKNAGFACFGSPSELVENIANIGLDQTFYWTEKRFKGIELIKKHFGNKIDYLPCGASELFGSKAEFETYNAQINDLNKHLALITGKSENFFIDKNLSTNCGFKGLEYAISNTTEGAIHPAKLLHELYNFLVFNGVNIFKNCEVESLEENTNEVLVKTNTLGELSANYLSICTNAFTQKLLPKLHIKPGRGQVLITEPINGLNWNRTFHMDKGYVYFRNVNDRILIGGARNMDFETETSFDFELNQTIQQHLEKILSNNILPEKTFKIEHRWTGIMAFTEDHIPISKMHSPRIALNVAMNGMGVALAPILANELAEKYLKT
jgi:gamma-glutamylputrescine oxidase